MAEQYNPVVRERQRQHIRELMQQDQQELLRQLDKKISALPTLGSGVFESDLIRLIFYHFKKNPYPTLHLGPYSWRFYVYMRRLQTLLCKDWHFCEKVRDPQNLDRVELATKLADFVGDNGIYRGGIDLPAAVFILIDPKDLCGCEDAE